jgi:serine/threonine-protein kinase RsbT
MNAPTVLAAQHAVLTRTVTRIEREEDIITVRRQARAMAQERGFDTFAVAALTTACSELARNVWVHAGGGEAVLEAIADGDRPGVRVEFRDEGPGIADVDRVLAGGYSTARSLGLGVSGTRRLVDEFELASQPGRGTTVRITKWARY